MKVNGWLLSICVFVFPFVCFGQTPPPNDNYSNRIVLTGTDVTFTGTLAGATIEDSQETLAYDNQIFGVGFSQSIWWAWTAPVSTVLTLQMVSNSVDYLNNYPFVQTVLAVYNATNGSTSPSGLVLPELLSQSIDPRLSPQTLCIPVIAGTEYEIQLIGASSGNYSIRLVATNTPIIIEQPKTQAVYSNASVLFYVVSAGINQTNFTFQWLRNGYEIGQTAPMLALSHIDASLAGDYSVVVSNSAGFTISEPATLTISQSNVPISLSVMGIRSNSFAFSLTGENGRLYRIESSSDLVNWGPEKSFSAGVEYLGDSGSVVFNSNSPLVLTVPINSNPRFFRATPYVVPDEDAEICINHLREIRIAKLLWQRDQISLGDAITWTPVHAQLLPYFPQQTLPFCPLDSYEAFEISYSINAYTIGPTCLIHPFGPDGHLLEGPR